LQSLNFKLYFLCIRGRENDSFPQYWRLSLENDIKLLFYLIKDKTAHWAVLIRIWLIRQQRISGLFSNKEKIRAKPPSGDMKTFQKKNPYHHNTMKTHLIDDIEDFGIWEDDYEKFFKNRLSCISRELSGKNNLSALWIWWIRSLWRCR